jgi:hypothetical protein
MFIGHIAVAFAAKQVAPRTSLGTLAVAVDFTDLLWPIFLLLGWEQVRIVPGMTVVTPLDFISYPISHSLLADIGWASLLVGLYLIRKRIRKDALVIWACVMSHWILDAISHRPDLPLYPGGGVFVGLGLWNSLPGTLLVEGAMFAAGVAMYLMSTRAKDRTGVIAFWALITVFVILYLANVLGPPPPSLKALKIGALGAWLFVPWFYWIDRHRPAISAGEQFESAQLPLL